PVPLSPPDLTSEENALIVRLPEVLGLPDSLHDGGDVCRDIRFIRAAVQHRDYPERVRGIIEKHCSAGDFSPFLPECPNPGIFPYDPSYSPDRPHDWFLRAVDSNVLRCCSAEYADYKANPETSKWAVSYLIEEKPEPVDDLPEPELPPSGELPEFIVTVKSCRGLCIRCKSCDRGSDACPVVETFTGAFTGDMKHVGFRFED
ncbi:MAG: hypothetical protein GY820_42580, partial [Gammaproteobacteria bacterium]|nr:hypothetical protein [Gammaproteobacteria bacterium]